MARKLLKPKSMKPRAAEALTGMNYYISDTTSMSSVDLYVSRDDSDHGDIQFGWLNSPYRLLQNLERDTAELEAKINADPDFSDKHKQEFIAGLIDPIKDGNQCARAVDAYIINGVPLPDFKD